MKRREGRGRRGAGSPPAGPLTGAEIERIAREAACAALDAVHDAVRSALALQLRVPLPGNPHEFPPNLERKVVCPEAK